MTRSEYASIIFASKILLLALLFPYDAVSGAMTVEQMQVSMAAIRSICGPKHKVSDELIDGLKKGQFVDNKGLKCYTMCVGQFAGTISKKNEISYQKVLAQIENLLPDEIKENSRKVLEECKDVQNGYKDSCDKVFYTTKCMYDYNPAAFMFP